VQKNKVEIDDLLEDDELGADMVEIGQLSKEMKLEMTQQLDVQENETMRQNCND